MTDLYIPSCPRCGDPVTSGCYPASGICQGVRVVSRRALRLAAQQRANAALCRLTLTDYFALTRCQRKRRLWAAKKGARRG